MNKIIYLDASASCLKPDAVIDAEMRFLRDAYANSGRGVCARATAVDDMVTNTRARVAEFINASSDQVVFTSGATDGLNRVVNLARQMVRAARPVVCVSDLDHHSARLPWLNLSAQGAADIVVAPLDAQFNIDAARLPRADIMVITAMSNVMGIPQDVSRIIRAAREKNPSVVTIVDAAQYAAHNRIDVNAWGCDFMCFSGHKIGADTGIGVMYVRDGASLQPDKFGGGMVLRVDGDKIIPNIAPDRFEAGTLPLTQAVGMAPAIDWLTHNPTDSNLVRFLYDELSAIPRIRVLSRPDACMVTFVVDGMHVLDFGALAGARGLCLRVGNMCATWIHRVLGVPGTIRISPGPWNSMDEMQKTVDIIKGVVR